MASTIPERPQPSDQVIYDRVNAFLNNVLKRIDQQFYETAICFMSVGELNILNGCYGAVGGTVDGRMGGVEMMKHLHHGIQKRLRTTDLENLDNQRMAGSDTLHGQDLYCLCAMLGVIGYRLSATPSHDRPEVRQETIACLEWATQYRAKKLSGVAMLPDYFKMLHQLYLKANDLEMAVSSVDKALLSYDVAFGRFNRQSLDLMISLTELLARHRDKHSAAVQLHRDCWCRVIDMAGPARSELLGRLRGLEARLRALSKAWAST